MGRIYQQATHVIAWIGREDNSLDSQRGINKPLEIEQAINFVGRLYGDSESTRYYNRSTWYYPNDYPQIYCNESSDWRLTASDPGWASLLSVCKRRYWTRLWIIQELILARDITIQCGRFLCRWKVIEHALCQSRPASHRKTPHPAEGVQILAELEESVPFKIYKQRNDRLEAKVPVHTLFELFYAHQEAECEQKHDRLFGLLGLSRGCCQEAIPANYNVSLPWLCRLFLQHHFWHHVLGPIGTGQEYLARGVQEAFLTFSDEVITPLQVYPSHKPAAITSMACKYLGETTSIAFDVPITSEPDMVVAFARFPPSHNPGEQSRKERGHVGRVELGFRKDDRSRQLASNSTLGFFDSNGRMTTSATRSTLCYPLSYLKTYPFRDRQQATQALKQSSFARPGGFFFTVAGTVEPGDLVYQLENERTITLRRRTMAFSVVAIGGIPQMTSPPSSELNIFPNFEFSDNLYIDYNNLRGCCLILEGRLGSFENYLACNTDDLVSSWLRAFERSHRPYVDAAWFDDVGGKSNIISEETAYGSKR
jgi:hypothetical protein